MKEHNAWLTKAGITTLPIPDTEEPEVQFTGGVQLGANTMYRTGDGIVARKSPDSVSYKLRIGYRTLGFTFRQINIDGYQIEDPQISVGNNSIMFDFTITNGTKGCTVHLDEYKYVEMDDIKSQHLTADELLDLTKVFMAHINSALEKKKPQVERHLSYICSPPKKLPVSAEPSLAVSKLIQINDL